MQLDELRGDLARSTALTIQEQARRNELRIAWVRLVAVGAISVLDIVAHRFPDQLGEEAFSIWNGLVAACWSTVSLGLVWVLRRGWYRPWLSSLAPLLDGAILGSLFTVTLLTVDRTHVRTEGALSTMAAVSCLLAVSGGLRLRRGAVVGSAATAVGVYIVAGTLAGARPLQIAILCGVIAASGFMALWMTLIVGRVTQAEVARSVLGRFLPRAVLEAAHSHELAPLVEPRRVEATIVFTDIRGFTTIAEGLAPEEVLRFLNDVQGRLAEAVRAHGGTVDKFLGDGMLAVFGAPEPLEDHAARALAATMAMGRAIHAVRTPGGDVVDIGVGVHSGPVVVGCLGSGARLEFTVLGDTVNTASRLQSMTKELGCRVLVSDDTLAAAGPHRELATLVGEVPIRGRTEPLRVHSLRISAG